MRRCPGQASYSGSERNGIKSREWGEGHPGVSYKVERCLQHTAGTVPPPELSLLHPGPSRQMPTSLLPIEAGPGESFLVPPSACLVVFNLSNEPCYKYSLPLVADQATTADRCARVLALLHRRVYIRDAMFHTLGVFLLAHDRCDSRALSASVRSSPAASAPPRVMYCNVMQCNDPTIASTAPCLVMLCKPAPASTAPSPLGGRRRGCGARPSISSRSSGGSSSRMRAQGPTGSTPTPSRRRVVVQ